MSDGSVIRVGERRYERLLSNPDASFDRRWVETRFGESHGYDDRTGKQQHSFGDYGTPK